MKTTYITTLCLTSDDGTEVYYSVRDIDQMIYRKAKDIYNENELDQNNLTGNEQIFIVKFKNDSTANFNTRKWRAHFKDDIPQW